MLLKPMISAMGAMMERMGPMSVHHVSTRPPSETRNLADEVYAQMRRDFFVASPFQLHASEPALLAAAWSLVRETLMCGEVPRGEKEVIAWAISAANQCPFCVGAHHAAVKAAEVRNDALQAWAKSTARSFETTLGTPPFDHHPAEYLGTVVAFHYLNRMVSVFLDKKLMPTPDFMDGAANAMAKVMMGGMIDKGRHNRPGESLELIPVTDASLAWRPAWAESSSHVAAALSGWSAVCEAKAIEYVDPSVIEVVRTVVDDWDGTPPALTAPVLDAEVPEPQRALAELALLTAIAPHRVNEDKVLAVGDQGASDHTVLAATAWAAQRAARRVGDWTASAGGFA